MNEIVQRSPEWFAIRCGKATSSRMADLTARTKSGWGASRANYMAELIAERLTGIPATSYTNAAMQWGTDTEPQARAAYEFYTDTVVKQVGFVEHPTIPHSGASPDGIIADIGVLEIKCPNTATHIDTLMGGGHEKYIKQMQWQMTCTGAHWCDFVPFDPRMPENMRMIVKRVERDNAVIKVLEKDVVDFLAELDAKVAALIQLYGASKAA